MDLENIPGAISKKSQAGNRPAKATKWGHKRNRQYGSKADLVRAEVCIAAGQGDPCEGHVEACHGVALSHDPNSDVMFAACTRHHEMSDGRRRLPEGAEGHGREAFERYFGVSIQGACAAITLKWTAFCKRHDLHPEKQSSRPRAKKLIEEGARAEAHTGTHDELYRLVLGNVESDLIALEGARTQVAQRVRQHLYGIQRILRGALKKEEGTADGR